MFTLNGIQTQSGYCYNLINDLPSMSNLVDVVRLSPLSVDTFDEVRKFKANETGSEKFALKDARHCNGYWHNIAGLDIQM